MANFNVRTLLGPVLVVTIILSVGILTKELSALRSAPTLPLLTRVWSEDLHYLREQNRLPKAFEHLRMINIKGGDEHAATLLKETKIPLRYSPRGLFDLEILMTTWEAKKKWGVIIQYDLIDNKGNTVWELGRTLEVGHK